MNGFGPSLVQPSPASQDPTKHVNYALGMVLGVDDLNQEFAYHSQRAQWTARDLIGYGTAWGLKVDTREHATRGPEVTVSSGVAINPHGQLIRVAPAQCAALNEWLSARSADVLLHRLPTSSPNIFELPLYVVLSYRTCLTDPVPIAGEPCRSESDTVKPSRVADNFLIELAFEPPPQQEEDAIREFVEWLRGHVTVSGGGTASHTVQAFLNAIRAAKEAAKQSTSPAGPPNFLGETSPPFMLVLPAPLLHDYLQAVMRLWLTELRPSWRPMWLNETQPCTGSSLAAPDQGNRLLLAQVTPRIQPIGLNQAECRVTSLNEIVISEERRPLLLHLRFIQELLLKVPAAASAATIVAGGIVNADGTPSGRSLIGGLAVGNVFDTGGGTELTLSFAGYSAPPSVGGPQYLIKVLPSPAAALANVSVSFARYDAAGFVLLATSSGTALGANVSQLQLMIEVSQYS